MIGKFKGKKVKGAKRRYMEWTSAHKKKSIWTNEKHQELHKMEVHDYQNFMPQNENHKSVSQIKMNKMGNLP